MAQSVPGVSPNRLLNPIPQQVRGSLLLWKTLFSSQKGSPLSHLLTCCTVKKFFLKSTPKFSCWSTTLFPGPAQDTDNGNPLPKPTIRCLKNWAGYPGRDRNKVWGSLKIAFPHPAAAGDLVILCESQSIFICILSFYSYSSSVKKVLNLPISIE